VAEFFCPVVAGFYNTVEVSCHTIWSSRSADGALFPRYADCRLTPCLANIFPLIYTWRLRPGVLKSGFWPLACLGGTVLISIYPAIGSSFVSDWNKARNLHVVLTINFDIGEYRIFFNGHD
jgi:hypothetical protein